MSPHGCRNCACRPRAIEQGPEWRDRGHVRRAPIELVLKDHEIVFYLRDDDGSALPTKDMHGRATIQDAGKTITVTLEPAAPNMLTGKVQAPLGAKARVVFSAKFRSGSHTHTLTARYVTQ
jgi:hypothetical protein